MKLGALLGLAAACLLTLAPVAHAATADLTGLPSIRAGAEPSKIGLRGRESTLAISPEAKYALQLALDLRFFRMKQPGALSAMSPASHHRLGLSAHAARHRGTPRLSNS